MKDRRGIPAGTLNGVYQIAARYMKGAKNVPHRGTNQGL